MRPGISSGDTSTQVAGKTTKAFIVFRTTCNALGVQDYTCCRSWSTANEVDTDLSADTRIGDTRQHHTSFMDVEHLDYSQTPPPGPPVMRPWTFKHAHGCQN